MGVCMGTVHVHVFGNVNVLYFLRTIAEVVVPIITYMHCVWVLHMSITTLT